MKYENEYLNILKEELKKAMGCTEPIAVSYLSATLKDLLGCIPSRVDVHVSGNILKNVKSVVVPNTDGMRGIASAIGIGVVAGVKELKLECLSKVTSDDIVKCKEYLKNTKINIYNKKQSFIFDISIVMYTEDDYVEGRIVDNHTNIVYLRKNDCVILDQPLDNKQEVSNLTDHSVLNVADIFDFANNVELSKVEDLINDQITCNMQIAKIGLKEKYGANIGKTLLKSYPSDISTKAKAYAAAASDARMNGCELPVVINSGSGNQGITCSVPVIVYAEELKVSKEKLIRALVLSNLLTAHMKSGIGRLSAFCGAVAAGCAAGAAIAYLHNGDLSMISHTIVNSLAIVSGIICDGAKASCAAKIASSVDAGILGFKLYQEGNQFYSGDGIVTDGVDNTIKNVGILASQGMAETDKEIINIMLKERF
ncbi:MAG: serine dehydratase subunit alpha family protein [Bacilli bacterium]|nr:serine dehydratase subunit alpha family protein [Bacilli bacterium]